VLDESQRGRIIAKNKRREMLKSAFGYVPHPGLGDDGRVPLPLPDGQRPRLYVKPGHPSEHLQGAAVTAAYLEAQGSLGSPEPPPFFTGSYTLPPGAVPVPPKA
jgi:hypothetical protein